VISLFHNALRFPEKIGILDHLGEHTYGKLWERSAQVANHLLQEKGDLNQARIAFLVDPGFAFVATQWAIWRAGGIAVPLCLSYPLPSLAYVIEDSQASCLIVDRNHDKVLDSYAKEKGLPLLLLDDIPLRQGKSSLPTLSLDRGALILYTSGTTSLPKGVLSTHATLESQIRTLIHAWEWTEKDHTLCLLPLHHVHGLINIVSCALCAGATLEFLHPFEANQVFDIFLKGNLSVFMAVPTIYFKLISEFDSYSESRKNTLRTSMKRMRLMVSGSAALPQSVMERWQQVSGHYLLERYGMTEIGMAISNPYRGERRAGYIGMPLPGVEVRLVNEQNQDILPGEAGEIQVKGPSVFAKYWQKPDATKKSFTQDGWFKTGDIACIERGYYKILGRDSVDIIKSGGYKLSALEIEEVLRRHSQVIDCAVVGIPDEEWGEKVAAGIVSSELNSISEIKEWLKSQLPSYKIPKLIRILEELPRNAMGKVVKNEVKKYFCETLN